MPSSGSNKKWCGASSRESAGEHSAIYPSFFLRLFHYVLADIAINFRSANSRFKLIAFSFLHSDDNERLPSFFTAFHYILAINFLYSTATTTRGCQGETHRKQPGRRHRQQHQPLAVLLPLGGLPFTISYFNRLPDKRSRFQSSEIFQGRDQRQDQRESTGLLFPRNLLKSGKICFFQGIC